MGSDIPRETCTCPKKVLVSEPLKILKTGSLSRMDLVDNWTVRTTIPGALSGKQFPPPASLHTPRLNLYAGHLS